MGGGGTQLLCATYANMKKSSKIFEKGESGKEHHSGIGLWEVRKYVMKSKNLDLFTSKTEEFFKQELSIYDIIKNSKKEAS